MFRTRRLSVATIDRDPRSRAGNQGDQMARVGEDLGAGRERHDAVVGDDLLVEGDDDVACDGMLRRAEGFG